MWQRLGGAGRWLGVRLLVAIAVWAVLYLSLNAYMTVERNRAMAWFTANGYPTYPSQIEKETVDPKDDAGPLWRAAAELYAAAMIDYSQGPAAAQLKDGKLVASFDEGERSLTAAEIEQLRKTLADNQEILDLLHRAALRPGYNSPIDYTRGILTVLPDVFPSLHVAEFARLAAEVALYDGNPDVAIERWTSLRELQRWNDAEPILVSQLVAATQEGLFTESMQQGLRAGTFDEKQLARMAALAAPVRDWRWQVRRGLQGELACFFNPSVEQLYTGDFSYPPDPTWRRSTGLARLVFLADHTAGLTRYRRLFESLEGDFLPSQVTPISRDDIPRYAISTRLMMPAMNKFPMTLAKTEAARCTAAWAVALRRQKLATGAYPDRLAGVRPEFAPPAADATDPFSGQSLVYRRKGEGFVVYSVGPDVVDEGGRADDVVLAMEK
jgi:hypothetical protein